MGLVDKSRARVTDDVIPRFLFLVTHELAVFVGGLTLSYLMTSPLHDSIFRKIGSVIRVLKFWSLYKGDERV